MRKSHARLWLCIAVFLIALIYSVAVFMLKKTMDVTAWALYAFTMISVSLLLIQLAFGTGGIRPLPQFDYVNTFVAVFYCGFQLVVFGIILMMSSNIPICPIITVESVILATYLVYMFVLNAAISHTKKQDAQTYDALSFIRTVIADIEFIGAQQDDTDIKKRLLTVAQDLRYQDVTISSELSYLNAGIAECVSYMKSANEYGDGNIRGAVEKLESLITERRIKSKRRN